MVKLKPNSRGASRLRHHPCRCLDSSFKTGRYIGDMSERILFVSLWAALCLEGYGNLFDIPDGGA